MAEPGVPDSAQVPTWHHRGRRGEVVPNPEARARMMAPEPSGVERRGEVLALLEQVGRLTAWIDATVRILALADDTAQVERLAAEVEVVTERRRRLLRQAEAAIELRYLDAGDDGPDFGPEG